ncbi:hypothetical protein Tco_0930225, partial [Tanacetum coccineum]
MDKRTNKPVILMIDEHLDEDDVKLKLVTILED